MDKYGELYAFSRRKIKKLRNKRVPRREETDGEAAHGFLSARRREEVMIDGKI